MYLVEMFQTATEKPVLVPKKQQLDPTKQQLDAPENKKMEQIVPETIRYKDPNS